MRARALLPLTAAVLAAHAWLLWQLPAWSGAPSGPEQIQADVPAFVTRRIALAPPAPPPPVPAPAPRPQAKPRPRPAAPPPPPVAPAPAPVDAAAVLEEDTQPADAPEAAAPEAPEELRSAEPVEMEGTVELATAEPPAPETLQDAQVQLPPPARLSFEVSGQAKRFDYRASAELLWQHDGHSYQARQQIKAFLVGARAQESRGQITAAGLVPQRFTDQGRREKSAELDFAAGQARFTPAAAPAPIGLGAQDRLSVFFQLSALLAAAPERYPAGSEISFTTVGSNDAERWTFRVQALETLELPVGTLAALHLERLPRHAGDQQAALWLAPSLGYLPARILLTQADGDFADLRLQGHAPP